MHELLRTSPSFAFVLRGNRDSILVARTTPLTKAKFALSFATYSCTKRNGEDRLSRGGVEKPKKPMQPVPTLVTLLLVGCLRKVVLYSWKDGEPQEVKVSVR
jgi:hypothetical protein